MMTHNLWFVTLFCLGAGALSGAAWGGCRSIGWSDWASSLFGLGLAEGLLALYLHT